MTINFLTLTNLGADFDLGTRVLNKVNIVSATSPQISGGTDNSSFIKPDAFASAASSGLNFALNARTLGAGSSSSAALVNIGAGTSSQSPIILASGVLLTTPHAGAFEYDGMKVYFTPSTETRQALAFLDSPVFTGTPSASTAAPGTNTTQLATTAFVATAVATVGGAYLPLGGGTLTGTLNINSVNPLLFLNKTSTSASSRIVGATNGVTRWLLELGNATAESADTGSNFVIARYNDAGTLVDIPLTISRGTGIISLPNILVFPTAAGNDSSNQGATTAFVANNFIARTGGSMTGNLSIVNANPTLNLNKAASGGVNQLIGYTNSSPRWDIQLGNGNGETGSNVGSDLGIYRYDDSGVFIDGPMSINRSSGIVYFNHIPVIPTATTGDNSTQVATTAFVATAVATGGGAYLPLSGGTITGSLAISSTNGILTLNKSASGASTSIFGKTGNLSRWWMQLGNGTAETGANAGSDFYLSRYNDAGAYIDSPLFITRSSGSISTTSLYTTGYIQVNNPSDSDHTLLVMGSSKAIRFGTATTYSYIEGVSNTLASYQPLYFGGSFLAFTVGGVEKARFDASGNFCIGGASGSHALEVVGDGNFNGNLTARYLGVAAVNPYVVLNKTTGQNAILGQTSGLARWQIRLGDTNPETGSNSGSDFYVDRWADDGSYLSSPIVIVRSSGFITLNGAVFATTPAAGTNSTQLATTQFVATSFAPLANPSFSGLLYTQFLKFGGGAANLGGASYATINTSFATLANSGCVGFGWNYSGGGGGGETDMFISRNGGNLGGLKIFDFPATSGAITNIFSVDGAGNVYSPGTMTVGARINSGGPGSGGIWVDGGSQQLFGSISSTTMGLYNNGVWVVTVDNTGHAYAPTASIGTNDTQIATTAFVASAVATGGGAYLPLSGGTLTGNLNISTANSTLNLNKSASGGVNQLIGYTNNNPRWNVQLGNGIGETGSDAGSDFAIYSYNDAGASNGNPFSINRSTGSISTTSLYTSGFLQVTNTGDNDHTFFVVGATKGVRIGTNASYGVIEGVQNTIATYQPLAVGGSQLLFTVGGIEKARFDTSGHFLIGQTSGSHALEVNGEGYFVGAISSPYIAVPAVNPYLVLSKNSGSTGQNALVGQTAGVSRWQILLGDGNPETGSNVGSDFYIHRFDDAGAPFPPSMSIQRSTGYINFKGLIYSTGNIEVAGANADVTVNKTAGTGATFTGKVSGLARWQLVMGNSTAESGSNAGSDFGIARFTDSGAYIDAPFFMTRSTGQISISTVMTVPTPAAGSNTSQVANTAFVTAAVATGVSAYLPLSGGTITGNLYVNTGGLSINSTYPAINLNKSTGGAVANQIQGSTAGLARWLIQPGTAAGETGSNVGSDFGIYRYADDGSYIDEPLAISRPTGIMYLNKTPVFPTMATSDNSTSGATTAFVKAVTAGGYLPLTGGVLSGNLYINAANSSLVLTKTASGGSTDIYGQTGGLTRWWMQLGNGTAESGANAGSDFYLSRYNDAGVYIDSPFYIPRSSGSIITTSIYTNGFHQVTNTSDNDHTLFVVGATKAIRFGTSAGYGAIEGVQSNLATYQPLWVGGSQLLFSVSGVEKARFDTSGNLCIGTTSGSHALEVVGDGNFNGNLTARYLGVATASPYVVLNKTTGASGQNAILGQTAGISRWQIRLGDGNPEGTGNAGSDFYIDSFADSGTYLTSPIVIARSSGNINLNGAVFATTLTAGTNNTQLATTQFVQTAVAGYLPLTGGTISGDISLNNHAYPTLSLNKNATGASQIMGLFNSAPRWLMRLGDESVEGGSNTGSNFLIYRYNDAGVYLDSPLQINRATGEVSFSYIPTFPTATAGSATSLGANTAFVANAVAAYLPLVGGGMTGNLYLNYGYPSIILNKTTGGAQANQLLGQTANNPRWLLELGNTAVETGTGNTGSDFGLHRYGDAGNYLGTTLSINRGSGNIYFDQAPIFPTQVAGTNDTHGATTAFVSASFAPISNPTLLGLTTTQYLKVAGGSTNLGGASYATINSVFGTLAGSAFSGFGWNYSNGGGELDLFISYNGGLQIYNFPNTSGAITKIFQVDGAGNAFNPGVMTVGGRISSGGPSTGGLFVDGASQFVGSLSSTQMGLYNNGHWAVVVDNTGAATAPTVSYGANDTQIATTAYVYNAFAKRIVFDSDFGCVGDNSTDDTTAITNFINHAIANPGVEHRFRSLTYKITNVLPDINVSGVIIRGAGSDIHNSDGSHISGTVLNYSGGGAIEHVLRITSVDSTSSLVLTNVQFTGIGINCNSLVNAGLYVMSVTDSVVDVTIINAIYVGLYMTVVGNLLVNEARDNQRNKITLSSRQLEAASGSALWCDGDEVANTSLNEFWVNALHATGTAIELKNSDNNIWRQIRTYATGALGSTYSVRCYGNASSTSFRYSRNELFEFTSSNRPIQVDGMESFPSGRASTDHVLQHIDFGNEWHYPAVQTLGTIRLPYQAISVKGNANDVLIEAINTYSIGLSVQGTVRWKVDGAGGHFIPTADYAYNIGGASNRVAELYAVNTHFTTVTTGSVTAASSINTDYLYSLNSFTAFSRSTTATSGNVYTQLYAADGVNVAIYLGASGGAYTDPTTYYRNTNHVIGSVAGAAVYLTISSTAATFNIPVYAPTAAVGTNNTQVATTGFVHNALTGSPAAPVQTFTLEQFGGAGDGTTSNDSAWSSALTSIGGGSGTVVLGSGTYVFSAGVAASIASGKSLTVKGQGADVSIILFSSNSGMTLAYGNQYSSSHVRDLSFKCGTTGGFALSLSQASSDTNPANTALSDVTGVTFTGADGYSATNYFSYSLFINNVSNVNVISCSFNMPAGQGVGIQVQGDSAASTYGVVYNLLNCVFFGGNINFVYGEWVQGVTIAQTNFTGSNIGIYTTASEAGSLQGLAVSSCQFACVNENILLSTQVSNVCLSNNLFLNANYLATATIFVYGLLVNFNIVGNQFNASPQGTTQGIIVTGGGNGTITGNVFGGLYKGFDLTASTSNIIVQSNSYVNVGTGATPVLYTNSGTNNIIGGGHP
jgi:hypothetical protein